MSARFDQLRANDSYRACVAVLEEYGIAHTVEWGSRHPRIVFEFRGERMSKILSRSRRNLGNLVHKAAADIRRMLREVERRRPKREPERASVLQAEPAPAPSADQLRTRTMDDSTASDGQSNQPIVSIVDGKVQADSRDIARCFGRRHGDVLRAIRDAECSDEFRRRNFAYRVEIQSHSTGSVKREFVLMTRDGFAFVVMGFTGTKAAQFKEAFIDRYNAMELELQRMSLGAAGFTPDVVAMIGGVVKAVVRKAIADEVIPVLADLKAADELILDQLAVRTALPRQDEEMIPAFDVVDAMVGVPSGKRYSGLAGQVSTMLSRFCARHGFQVRIGGLPPDEKLVFPRQAAIEWLNSGGREEIWRRVNSHRDKRGGQGCLKLVPTV